MLARFKRNIGALAALSALTWAGSVVNAQTLTATVTQPPTGANSIAKVQLSFDPAGEGNIVFPGFDFAVLYSPSLGTLIDATPLQFAGATVIDGAEQTQAQTDLEFPGSTFDNFKKVNGDAYVDTVPDPDVEHPWSSASPFVELVFQMSPSYTGATPFSFDIKKYGSFPIIVGDGGDEVVVNTPYTIPPAVYQNPAITDVTPDGTHVEISGDTITISGTGFYGDGAGPAPDSGVKLGAETLPVTSVTFNSITATVTQAQLQTLGLGQKSLTVSNAGGPIASANFAIVNRDTVFVDDSFVAVDGELVDATTPLRIIGANAFNTISEGVGAVNEKALPSVAGVVNVAAGDYADNATVVKAMSIVGADKDTVKIASAGAALQQQLITVESDGVAISGVGFEMNNTVGGGIVALGRTDLSVTDCKFTLPADATGGKPGGGKLASGGWGPKGIMFQGINAASSDVTLTGNIFDNLTPTPSTSYYQYAMHVENAAGSIAGNKSIGAYRDLFLSQATAQVTGNTFATNVDVSNPAGLVNIAGNDFGRTATAFPGAPAFWHNEAAVTLRSVQATASVTVDNNDFENTARGVWVGASQNVTVNNNRFTPSNSISIDLGDVAESGTEYAHIIIDSKSVTSNTPAATTNNVVVTNNTFNGSAAHGHGLEFRNQVAGSTFDLSLTGNIFNSSVVEFVHVGANFTNEINLASNTVSVNSETGTPSALSLANLFALEDKTHHKLDSDGGPALVRWVAGNVYVTGISGSIQRGINAAAAGENVQVQDSAYTELVQIAKTGIKLLGNGLPTVTAPTSAQNDAVIKVTSGNVRVQGFDVVVNQPDAAVGIAAPVAAAAGVEILGNTVTSTGGGAAAVAGLLPFGQVAGISVMNPSGDSMLATVSANTVGTEAAPFKTFGIAFERSHGTVASNTIYGEDFDLLTRFVNNGATLNITGNNFNGWGDDGNKGAQVEVGDSAFAIVNVTGNVFTPRATTSPNLKVNRRSLQLKNHYSNQSTLNVANNTFNVVNTGLALTNVYNAIVDTNTFIGAANNALLLEVNNKIYSSADSHQNFDQNNATIQGNTFSVAGVFTGVKALEFRDHTQGNVPHPTQEIVFANYVIGGSAVGDANTFNGGLDSFIRLDDSVGNTNTHPAYSSTPFVSVMEPVSESFVAKDNLFDVSGTAELPSAMGLDEISLLNGKIYDRHDNTALGLVLLFERVTNITNSKKFDYIQDAINDPATVNGHTITADAGVYAESNGSGLGLVIDKSVTVLGPNATVIGAGTRSAEAQIVPGVLLNAGTDVVDTDAVVKITASDVVFKGLAVSGDNPSLTGLAYAGMNVDAGTGIKVLSEKAQPSDPYPAVDNVVIENNIVADLTHIGVFFYGYNSPAVGPRYYGARILNNLMTNVQDLTPNGYGYGLLLQAASGVVSGNTITNVRKGMQIQPYRVSTAVAGENKVVGNIINPWSIGIYYNYADTGASSWTIGDALAPNTITAASVPLSAANVPWEGIRVEGVRAGSAGATISANIITGTLADAKHLNWSDYGVTPAVWGLRLIGSVSEDVAFTNNNISGVQYGFLHESDSNIPAAGFSGNTFAAAGDYIRLQKYRANDLTIAATGGAGDIDATNGNTYGIVASGSAALADLYVIEDKVEHVLDNVDLGLVRVVNENLYVTVSTDGIQRAVNVANAGDTINVNSGTYTEAGFYGPGATNPVGVLVDKAVKLYGPNLTNSASLVPSARNAEAIIIPGAVLGELDSWNPVVGIAADGVEFKGFSVNGDNPANTSPHNIASMNLEASSGILSEGNNVQIANNIVDGGSMIGIRSAGWFDNNASYPNFENVHITSNLVRNYHSTGYGYGIYMQGSTGTVNSNKVEECRQGMQIQPYNNVGTGLQANNNVISAWHRGLWYNYADPSASRWTIEGNTITASTMPASFGFKTLWEGIRAQGVHSSSAGVLFKLNNVNGAVAQADPAHDSVGDFAEAVWGINFVSGTSNDVDLDTNTASNVSIAVVHSAAGELALTGNNFTAATGDVISVQTETAVDGADLGTGGIGNIAVATNNTLNTLSTGNTALANQFAIEDLITHKLDDSSLGLARVVANKVFVTEDSGSITNGVVASASGDTVHVADGSFNGATIDKLVTVVSGLESIGKATVTGPVAMNIPAGNGAVNLNGFDFIDAGGVAVNGVAQNTATFSVSNSTFTGSSAAAAVGVESGKNGVLENLTITGGLGESVVLANVLNVDLRNSVITNNFGSGVVVYKWDLNGVNPATVDGVDITSNTISNNGVTIVGNEVTDVANFNAYGIIVGKLDVGTQGNVVAPSAINVNIDQNVIENNAATGIFLSELSTDNAGDNLVENNTVNANGWSGVFETELSQKNTDGIKVNSSRNVAMSNNFITNNKRFGVTVRSLAGQTDAGEGVALLDNHIFGNDPIIYDTATEHGGGLLLQLYGNSSQEIAAANNWWGHVYGPYVAVDNENGRGDAIDAQAGEALYEDWYGKRTYAQRWRALNDRDGDGLLDAEEDLLLTTDGDSNVVPAVADKDSDDDGFEDGVEVMLGSNAFSDVSVPTNANPLFEYAETSATDSDNDGYWDFYEVAFEKSPTSNLEQPELGDVSLSLMRQVIVLNTSIYARTPALVEADKMDLNRDGTVSNLDSIALRRFLMNTVKLPLDVQP